jgi:hypothetical protein
MQLSLAEAAVVARVPEAYLRIPTAVANSSAPDTETLGRESDESISL